MRRTLVLPVILFGKRAKPYQRKIGGKSKAAALKFHKNISFSISENERWKTHFTRLGA